MSSFALDTAKLGRAGYFQAGGKSGSWYWRVGDDPEPAATVGIQTDLRQPEDPRYRICYNSSNRETGESENIVIRGDLLRTAPPYGGVRWWFACPRCWRRRRALYLPPGSTRFACRRCHALRYSSQYEGDADRMLRKARKLWKRAGSTDGTQPYEKPKWMRWETFSRLVCAGRDATDRGDLLVFYSRAMPASLRHCFPGFEQERARVLEELRGGA